MMAMKDGAKGGRHYGGRSAAERAGERRARLLEGALELYGTQGYANTSIEQLCAAASISTRSFYEEMGSRENLLIALADDITGRASAAALSTLEETAELPVADRIARGFRAYLEVTCADARTARVCYIEVVGVSETVEQWRGEWRRRIGALLQTEAERAVAQGVARPRDYRLFAIAVIGAVNSLAQELARSDRDPDSTVTLDEICAEIIGFVDAGIA
ncbi:TetR/AcrR family transcriptional regulator [Nocardia terpenica]|nr:TetR/AcrR family transcriptional regulator [Nocardia terpenica]MBF6109216.1 TetR/AcrR family transcriptional regulator [Nocardia terpenica]MBF6116337.1 TetR/AcrR family transcriptional regulator [Nocardia terpenica]MBF6123494.1 TetR/AcrR family transcriptional regulator [Nocardia terpenica]MBF6156771.1 TetR/AcrR family transcriptional regulator [Nocardia terpenica]